MSFTDKTPVGFEQLTVSTSAVGPTASKVSPPGGGSSANYGFFVCETADVRWRDDGTNPTATVGELLPAGQEMEYDGPLNKLKFISATGSTATIDASYYEVT